MRREICGLINPKTSKNRTLGRVKLKQADAKALALQLHDNQWLAEGNPPVDQQGVGALPFFNWLETNHLNLEKEPTELSPVVAS